MVRIALFIVCFLTLIATAGPASAQKRVALIIGNGAYTKVGKLPNPTRDAVAVEAMLKAAGFDVVQRLGDLGGSAMRRALRDFSDHARDADIAVVFYAGHGIEVNGTNYLIPVDAVLERDIDVEDETVSLDRVSQVLDQAKRLRLIILDACRDNPFVRSMKRTVATRSIGRGLARVEVQTSDTLIAYAAKAGSTAGDGDGSNSPYTLALVKHLATPGLDVRLALGRVRDEVLTATANKQEPFVYGSLGGREIALIPSSPTFSPSWRPQASGSAAAREWQDVKDTDSIAVLESFVQRHKDEPVYAALAQERIKALSRQQTPVAKTEITGAVPQASTPAPAPAPKQTAALAPSVVEPPKPSGPDPALSVKPGSGQSFRDCDDCPEMVVVPAGTFVMGALNSEREPDEQSTPHHEGPQRRVTISQEFAVGKFEVTFAEWDACVAAGGCKKADDKGWGRANRPVINVLWREAKEYATWLSRKSGRSYRLPSEAEWEYAARAGTNTKFAWGNDPGTGNANCFGCGSRWDKKQTAPVGSFRPNAFGLHDMHGNVSEWVEDCWNVDYVGAKSNQSARLTGMCNLRVLRGGSWSLFPSHMRAASRHIDAATVRQDTVGFRLARTLDR
jgi:formylglycine-generating enzyme required for sulfatase activity